ncbi:MAG: XdhC family protein [Solirubrobacteraceae bacterium]
MIGAELSARAQGLAGDRVPFAVATVVRARRPTSVSPGDSALVLGDGTIEGFVGGLCASASVRLHALRVLETGEPLLLRLVPGDGDDALGTAREDEVVVERNPCLSGGALEIFIEPRLPAARMRIVGHSPIALALAEVARAAGHDVVRCDADQASCDGGDAALVVASHGSGEERVLGEALAAGVPYVALVAGPARGEAVRAALDVADELRAQLHTPAGLDLGASSPAEVAVSILAEMISVRRRGRTHMGAPAPGDSDPAVDPVCGMQVARSDCSVHLDTPSGREYFCCERCRDAYAGSLAADGAAR